MIMVKIRNMRVRMNHDVMGMVTAVRLRNQFFMPMVVVSVMNVAMFVT